MRAGKDEHVTYIGEGVAHGKPGSIMDLVKDKAKKMGLDSHGADYISGVYKVQSPNDRLQRISLTITDENPNPRPGEFPTGFRIQGEILEGVHRGSL